jgi:uncharacterized protein
MKPAYLIWIGVAMVAAAMTLANNARSCAAVSSDEVNKIEDALPARAPATPAKARKILVFDRTEGFVHDSIPVGDKAIDVMGKKTGAYSVTLTHDMDVFRPDTLGEYDAILFNNTTQLRFSDPQQREALLAFIKGGKGFIGIHAASDNFPTWPDAVNMIGGQFNGHPWGAGGCGGQESDGWAMKLDDPGHVLNKSFGNGGFILKDEIYQIKGPYSRNTHRVLLSLDMGPSRNNLSPKTSSGKPTCGRDDGDNPISWIKRCGEGRVFYCSLGHRKEIYWNNFVLRHYLAGIQWALGDLPADETPSAKMSSKPHPALAPK